MKKRKNVGCNLGLRKVVVVFVVLNMCWGSGWEFTFDYVILFPCIGTAGIYVMYNEEKSGQLRYW